MTSHSQEQFYDKIEDLVDRQLRNEQQYFDRLNDIFIRLETLAQQNKILINVLESQEINRLDALKEQNKTFIIALGEQNKTLINALESQKINRLEAYRQQDNAIINEISEQKISLMKIIAEQDRIRLEALDAQNKNLLKALDEQSKDLDLHRDQLKSAKETLRQREIGIELLQEEIAHHSRALLNAQAEAIYLRSHHPKAKIRQLLERFGFFIASLLPISLLRRSKRIVRKLFKG